jgi:hypothetical protein
MTSVAYFTSGGLTPGLDQYTAGRAKVVYERESIWLTSMFPQRTEGAAVR